MRSVSVPRLDTLRESSSPLGGEGRVGASPLVLRTPLLPPPPSGGETPPHLVGRVGLGASPPGSARPPPTSPAERGRDSSPLGGEGRVGASPLVLRTPS